MRPTTLKHILDIWGSFLKVRRPLEQVIAYHVRSHHQIGSQERTMIKNILFSTSRHNQQIFWHLEQAGHAAETLTLFFPLFYLKLYPPTPRDAMPPADFYMMSGLRQKLAAFSLTSGSDTTLLQGSKPSVPQPQWVTANCPPAWWRLFFKQYGDAAQSLIQPSDTYLPTDVVLTSRGEPGDGQTRASVQKAMADAGIETTCTPYSPLGLTLHAPVSTDALAQYPVMRQDQSSQLLTVLCDVAPAKKVLDLCAGRGGKTTTLRTLMREKSQLWATDINDDRYQLLQERVPAMMLGQPPVSFLPYEEMCQKTAQFDRVLVDAPCTGTGTWRRHPDFPLRCDVSEIKAYCAIQKKLLQTAWALVAPGGRLIYATCSILAQENEKQIARFLETHHDGVLGPLPKEAWVPKDLQASPFLKLRPDLHQTDGFFAASIQKR